jgi:DNA-directed RNA polymerase subunit H
LTKEIKKKDFTFEHELVPQHTILSNQLPSIRASDPAVLAIEAKPGDVLKIVRRSSTAGEIVVYRHVVED